MNEACTGRGSRMLGLFAPTTGGEAIQVGRSRLVMASLAFLSVFALIAMRLVDVTLFAPVDAGRASIGPAGGASAQPRADIVDRNGVLLATSLATVSLSANPRQIRDPEHAARRLVEVLPHLSQAALEARLASDSSFVYVDRHLTPAQHYRVNRLGIPGLYFHEEFRRIYPQGRNVAHVVGMADVDTNGIAGVEHYFDDMLKAQDAPLQLSLDIRVQHVVRDELQKTVDHFEAIGATGIVLDVTNGETVAMVSLPDFDPNRPETMEGESAFNRATKGIYEMGSVFKLFTAAMALDDGSVEMHSRFDATEPIRFARHRISDFHPENRWLTLPEVMVHSSNIGAARMAMEAGTERQQAFMQSLGMFQRLSLEVPETASPLLPRPWREINTMTIAYGHGLSVTPMHLANAVAAIAGGGMLRPATLVKRLPGETPLANRVIDARTSDQMRWLMRLVVDHGTGTRAESRYYPVGGKTGTAEKAVAGGYHRDARIASFVGAFPIDVPRYVVVAMIDEPKGRQETFGYATGGWVAAPAVGRIVDRIGPLLGLPPLETDAPGRDPNVLQASAAFAPALDPN